MALADSSLVSTHPDAWKEISERHWRRRMSGMEAYFVFFANLTGLAANGREHYTICTTVKLAKPIDIEHLKEAWMHLRFQQPQLAAFADPSDWTMHYTIPLEKDLKTWVDNTFYITENLSYDQFFTDFNPISTGSLYWLPQSNELIFRCPHWQIDGIGSWLFWDAFFTILEKVLSSNAPSLPWGEEVSRLSPTMKEIWKISGVDPNYLQQAQVMFGQWYTNIPGLGPDPIRKTPGKCQKLELEFDRATTTSIVEAIKKRGMSVTAAFHAAFACANAKVANHANVKSNYASATKVNFRKYLGSPYTSSDQAINVYFAPVSIVLPIETFSQTADFMNQAYKQTYDDPGKQQMICAMHDVLFQTIGTLDFASLPIPGDSGFSSLGVAERYFKSMYANGLVEISDLHNSVDVILGLALSFLYTFDGKLRFTYCYNDGLQDDSVIENLVALTEEILISELGI